MPLILRPFTVAICYAEARGAVVAGEEHERLLAQMQAVEFGDQLAHELVHVFDVVGIKLVFAGARFAVGRAHDRAVDVRHGIIEEEGLVLMARDEVHKKTVHDVGQVLSLGQFCCWPLTRVTRGLLAPVTAAAGEDEIFVEAPLAGSEAHLAPFADARGDIARLLHHGRNHDFTARLDGIVAVVVDQPGAEGITAGEELAARRPAQRRGIAIFETRAAFCQRVDLRRLERSAAAADVAQTDVVGQDENDVRTRGPSGSVSAAADGNRRDDDDQH